MKKTVALGSIAWGFVKRLKLIHKIDPASFFMSSLDPNSFTREECQSWSLYPHRNPRTKRAIKPNGSVFRRLQECADTFKIRPELPVTRQCSKTWSRLDTERANLYEKSNVIRCRKCAGYRFLHSIHTEAGDYICHLCGGDINLVYFCIRCHLGEEPEEA